VSHSTARGRSSIQRPTWFSGGSLTAGFFRVERLHQVDLDLERAAAHGGDVFVDVLALADVVAGHGQAEHVDPELLQPLLGGPPMAICWMPSTLNGRD
jgi:hypothetical protein